MVEISLNISLILSLISAEFFTHKWHSVVIYFRCDTSRINAVGQTALDIAEFWQHHSVASVLREGSPSGGTTVALTTHASRPFFCDSPLNRVSQRRTDDKWLNELQTSPRSIYILFTNLQPFCQTHSETTSLARVKYCDEIKSLLQSDASVVFLGVERDGTVSDDAQLLEALSVVGWFAIDVTAVSEEIVAAMCPGAEKLSVALRLLQTVRSESAIIAQARSMLAWHERYKFCPTCGKEMKLKEAGYKRQCIDEDCASNKGKL